MAVSFSIRHTLENAGVISGLQKVRQGLVAVGSSVRDNTRLTNQYKQSVNELTAANRKLNQQQIQGARHPAGARGPGGEALGGRVTGAGPFAITGVSRQFGTRAEAQQFLQGMKQVSGEYEKLSQTSKKYSDNANKVQKENRRTGVTFTQLLGLMIKFGIAMEIIMLPGRIIGGFRAIIDAGIEWEAQLVNINALLRTSRTELISLGRELNRSAVVYGSAGDILAAGYEAASSLTPTLIKDAQTLTSIQEDLTGEARATAAMVDLSAKASVAGATDIDIAMEGIVRTTSAFGLNFAQAEQALDIMFKTVKTGVVDFGTLASHIGEISSGIAVTFGSDTQRQLKEFEAVTAGIAAMTRTLPAAEAFTSMRNLMRDLGRQSVGGQRLINRLKELGANLTLDDFIAQGFEKQVKELNRTLMPHGTIIDMLVQKHGAFASVLDENNFRQARSTQLFQKLFPNIRTARGLQALLANDMALFNEALRENGIHLGETNAALEEQQDSVRNVLNSLSALGSRIKNEFFLAIRDPLKRGITLFKNWIDTVTSTEEFKKAGFFEKFHMLWDGMMGEFDKWWDAGGKEKTIKIAFKIGDALMVVLNDTLLSDKALSKYVDIGVFIAGAITLGIIKGVGTGLWGMIIQGFQAPKTILEAKQRMPEVGRRKRLEKYAEANPIFSPDFDPKYFAGVGAGLGAGLGAGNYVVINGMYLDDEGAIKKITEGVNEATNGSLSTTTPSQIAQTNEN